MKKSELWKIYTKRNPSFDGDGNVTMSAAGLRKLFNTTWDIAYYDGEDEFEPVPTRSESSNVEALKKIFGMK